MKKYQFLSGLLKCYNFSNQTGNISNQWRKCGKYIITLVIITFGSGALYAQHLFSVSYNDLPREKVKQIGSVMNYQKQILSL